MKDTNYRKYICRVALAENIEAGFVWLSEPKVESREIVRIKNIDENRTIFCQSLNIDQNFCKKYNNGIRITTINETDAYIVANKWYRDKLKIDKNSEVKLEVNVANTRIKKMWWAYLAAKKHPENSIRISTHIATLSLVLGALGIIFAITPLFTSCSKNEITNVVNVNDQSEVIKKLDKIDAKLSQTTYDIKKIQKTTKVLEDNLSAPNMLPPKEKSK